jgi:site-specific DNA recombinase
MRRTTAFAIELQGRLALLMGALNLYPNMRIAASWGTVVAEEGLEPPTHYDSAYVN